MSALGRLKDNIFPSKQTRASAAYARDLQYRKGLLDILLSNPSVDTSQEIVPGNNMPISVNPTPTQHSDLDEEDDYTFEDQDDNEEDPDEDENLPVIVPTPAPPPPHPDPIAQEPVNIWLPHGEAWDVRLAPNNVRAGRRNGNTVHTIVNQNVWLDGKKFHIVRKDRLVNNTITSEDPQRLALMDNDGFVYGNYFQDYRIMYEQTGGKSKTIGIDVKNKNDDSDFVKGYRTPPPPPPV